MCPLVLLLKMGIDKSEHIKDHLIISPVLGGISPQQLSTGCKATLYMLNNPGTYIRGERFGDNCFEWLGKVGELNDIHITLCHYLDDDVDLVATITNTGVVHNSRELNKELLEADIKEIEDTILKLNRMFLMTMLQQRTALQN